MAETLLQQAFDESREKLIAAICKLKRAKRLEYVESTGTQYIDTGVLAADNVGVRADIVQAATDYGATQALFGVFGSDNRFALGISSGASANKPFAWWNTAITKTDVISYTGITVSLNYLNSRAFSFGAAWSGLLTKVYNTSNTQIRIFNALRMDTGDNVFSPSASYKLGGMMISVGRDIVRDYIPVKDSQGVAGLLDLVSSQIFYSATATALVAGPDKLTTRDYVQDGLVAMWDGIENVGREREHDGSATSWVNLAGGDSFSWTNSTLGVSFGSNYLFLENGGKTSNPTISTVNIPIGTDTTVEMVAKFDWKYSDNYANIQRPIRWIGAVVPCARYKGTTQTEPGISLLGNTGTTYYPYEGYPTYEANKIYSMSVSGKESSNPKTLTVNGESVSITRSSSHALTGTLGDVDLARCMRADAYVYSIRLYNRVLSAEEVATNYAVDKARFDLS